MIRFVPNLLALAMLVSVCVPVSAADEAAKTCSSKACSATACADGAGCPIEAAMAKLPKMTYLVGTQETCCPDAAATLAKESNSKIQFVAFKKNYDSKTEAMVALADGTEKFVSEFATPKTCAVSGAITVANKQLTCSVMAGKRAKVAKEAMGSVAMTYLVGTETCSCPNAAASIAKTTGVEKQFVIAGEKTTCSVDARVRLAHAKYKAAVTALAKLDSSEEEAAKL